MSRKITVTLDDVAEKHFDEVNYSFQLPHKKTGSSAIVSHCLGECKMFEDITGDQITNYLMENYPEKYQQWIKENKIIQYV